MSFHALSFPELLIAPQLNCNSKLRVGFFVMSAVNPAEDFRVRVGIGNWGFPRTYYQGKWIPNANGL
jgi:hypothetical protein